MKTYTVFLSAILIVALSFSCKKDKNSQPANPVMGTGYSNFSQLKIGNYWIYEEYDVDSTGNATSKNIFDSCYVEKDTIINNQTYLKVIKPDYTNQNRISFQRDSLHYVVNSYGKILFSSVDFSTVLDVNYFITTPNDTICKITNQMADKNQAITTPSGMFITSNFKETFLMYPNWSSAGNVRIKNTRYAINIGIVSETLPFFVSNPNYIERRLVRYHLN